MPVNANPNPGNFANRSKEEVREIASKGGQASHSGGFASMDHDKQVRHAILLPSQFLFPTRTDQTVFS
jgi:hypothetical protein